MNTVLYEVSFPSQNGKEKKLRIVCGDLCTETQTFDVVICSAYKNRYYPTAKSFIGSLFWDKNISVDMLASTPAIDMRDKGFWLSEEIPSNFKRIGCLELLEYGEDKKNISVLLKSKFSTMRYVLEQAEINNIKTNKVAMPLLGTGEQEIELPYIASALLHQAEISLRTIDNLDEINIYERDADRAKELKDIFDSIYNAQKEEEPQKVFISYSTKQSQEAHLLKEAIECKGYKCWIAPESIPTSSSYIEVIASALKKVQVVVLLLTQDAESSVWVIKEVGSALGSQKAVIPYRTKSYQLGDKFAFLLHDVQILTNEENPLTYDCLLEEIERKLTV